MELPLPVVPIPIIIFKILSLLRGWTLAYCDDPPCSWVWHVTENMYIYLEYTTQVNSAFRARWLPTSEVISQVLFTTVAHRGKTQLNFSSETQQSFREHNNLFENTTIFSRTQQYFREHNNIFVNTTIFLRTQQSFLEHNNLFQNTTIFFKTQHDFLKHNSKLKHNKIWWNTTKFQSTGN